MEYYSAIEKNKTWPFATTQLDPEDTTLREICQRKTTPHDVIYMWNLNKTEQNQTDTENKPIVRMGRWMKRKRQLIL